MEFTLTITADGVKSTDDRFTMGNLGLGDSYKPLNEYFQKADGTIIKRIYRKSEKKNTNKTLPRIAFQVFEEQISGLSAEEKKSFPVCRYSPNAEAYCGIYSSEEEFRRYRNTIEYVVYHRDNGEQFVIYCWNIFSTIIFVQECLKRWGEDGDKFILIYREKTADENAEDEPEENNQDITDEHSIEYYASMLLESKNLIFRGAPGTGKSYLAKQIALHIISNGDYDNLDDIEDEEEKKQLKQMMEEQVEFVQFHPSYDYSDFVEGLRPKVNDDGTMGFEIQDGIFKRFVKCAIKNYKNSQKTKETVEKEFLIQSAIEQFLTDIDVDNKPFQIKNGNTFYIDFEKTNEKRIGIYIPDNDVSDKVTVNIEKLKRMLESGQKFDKVKDVRDFLGTSSRQSNSYYIPIFNEVKKMTESTTWLKPVKVEELKKYIFIIDEINRGEISKIFGELFFSIDPGYRGEAGAVTTQYANMHNNDDEDPNEKFYIPENVYIIGTMNDIDRSVDTFDFAMRRRFRFVEIKADEHTGMLDILGDKKDNAINRMRALNQAIAEVDDLGENYQIGAAYFLKLKTIEFDKLWTDYLKPLLQEYVRGMYNEKAILKTFEAAYKNEANGGGTSSSENAAEGGSE